MEKWYEAVGRFRARGRRGRDKAKAELYNLAKDIGETTNLASSELDKVTALTKRMMELDAEITKSARPRGEFRE